MCALCGNLLENHGMVAQTAMPTKKVLAESQVAAQIGSRLPVFLMDLDIEFQFAQQRPSDSVDSRFAGFNPFTARQQETVREALGLWADVLPVTFVERSATAHTVQGIAFSNSTTITDVWGFAYVSEFNFHKGIWVKFDPSTDNWQDDYGDYSLLAILHEVGHTLGLSHPSYYDTINADYDKDALYFQDSRQYTVMSYFDADNTGADHGGKYASTPLLHDILAAQGLYGRNYATRVGDTVYGFNSTAGKGVFDFMANAQPIVTIWDGGGVNSLDLSRFATAQRIDLHPGSFSDVAGLAGNLSIAYGTFMRNVTGGDGKDDVTDNALDNRILGGGGDDIIRLSAGGDDSVDGGAGTDLLELPGTIADYRIARAGDGSLLIDGAYGKLEIRNVESIRFTVAGAVFDAAQIPLSDFNARLYLASNPDLLAAFGADIGAATQHWLAWGQREGRRDDAFNPLLYIASNKDLVAAFGLNITQATDHYLAYGWREGRPLSGFDSLAYIAADPWRIDVIGTEVAGGLIDYVGKGGVNDAGFFDGLVYIASHADLRAAFGLDAAAGVEHYLDSGYREGRQISFDPLHYLTSNRDLAQAFETDTAAAARHYITYGAAEGRATDSFDVYGYAGSNPDIVASLGYDKAAWNKHYLTEGARDGRPTANFDPVGYALENSMGRYNGWQEDVLRVFIRNGATGGTPFGKDQQDHQIAVGTSAAGVFSFEDKDWFAFDAQAGSTYLVDLTLSSSSSFNGSLTTYNYNLGQAQRAAIGTSTLTLTPTMSGKVYIELAWFTGGAQDYVIKVEQRGFSPQGKGLPDDDVALLSSIGVEWVEAGSADWVQLI